MGPARAGQRRRGDLHPLSVPESAVVDRVGRRGPCGSSGPPGTSSRRRSTPRKIRAGRRSQDLGLGDDPRLVALGERIQAEESARGHVDRGWIAGFVATLFAIHLARMGLDRTFLGILSPAVAVLGDLLIALVAAFGVIIPLRLVWRKVDARARARRLALVGHRAGGPRSESGHASSCSAGCRGASASRSSSVVPVTPCPRPSAGGSRSVFPSRRSWPPCTPCWG